MKIESVCAILILIIIVLLSYAYVSSEHYYKNVILQSAFEKLKNGEEIQKLNPEMNWRIVNMNIDGYINDKKIVFNQPSNTLHDPHSPWYTFTHKNTLAAALNNLVVIDIDSNEPIIIDDTPMMNHLPKTTVSAKTPHGYHYYFYNDTGTPVQSRVGLKINNKKYPVDLLSGPTQLIFLPPTRIDSACYRWLNSPFTHRIEPISKHEHLLDLFAYTKETHIGGGETVNACVSHSMPNLLCIVWDFSIIYHGLKYTCMRSSFELLHSNRHELLYRAKSMYYLILKHAPLKHFNAHEFVQHVADLIQTYNMDGGIVHLGRASSNTQSIAQFNSCQVHNYKKHKLPSNIIRAEQTLVQTSVFTHRPITIISTDILHEHILNDDNDIVVNEDMFLIIMISNKTRIPCICLMQVSNKSKKSESEMKADNLKFMQYYTNLLN